MRRVLTFLRWRSDSWLQKGSPQITSPLASCPYKLKGLRAYACWQANIFDNLRNHFLGIWEGLELPQEYLTEPIYPLNLNSDVMELDGDDL